MFNVEELPLVLQEIHYMLIQLKTKTVNGCKVETNCCTRSQNLHLVSNKDFDFEQLRIKSLRTYSKLSDQSDWS